MSCLTSSKIPQLYDMLHSALQAVACRPLTCHPADDYGAACWSQHDPETQLGDQTMGEVLITKGRCGLNSSSSQIFYTLCTVLLWPSNMICVIFVVIVCF